MTTHRSVICPLLGLLVLALSGCGSGTGSVAGKVTLKGKVVKGGTVTFVGADKRVVTAPIDTEGSYTIERIATGPARISVTPPAAPVAVPRGRNMMDPSKMGGPGGGTTTAPAEKPAAIPADYQNPDKSGLTYTVNSGKQEHNIELK